MIFSSMQLADAILWYSKMEKNNLNYITSSFVSSIAALDIFSGENDSCVNTAFTTNKIDKTNIVLISLIYCSIFLDN